MYVHKSLLTVVGQTLLEFIKNATRSGRPEKEPHAWLLTIVIFSVNNNFCLQNWTQLQKSHLL